MAARFNIEILQGSTFGPVIFVLRHKIVLTAAAELSATTLSVSPLAHAISSGATLTFGTVAVVTSANASIGARTIAINSLTTALAKGATAKGNLVDLTGFSARASIRANYADTTALASFTCTVVSPATNGEVTIAMPSTTTTTLPANITPGRADDILDLQANSFPTATELKLFNPGTPPYFWDLECFNTASPPIVNRWVYGRILVSAEATK
jgi:hypothetical protein